MSTIAHGNDARTEIKKGIDLVSNTVAVTLGPRGRNVAIKDATGYRPPLVTNDGVTIVRSITSKDDLAGVGVEIVKEVANKTNDVAGDGTTTASVLLQSIINNGLRAIVEDTNAQAIRASLLEVANKLADNLRKQAVTIEDNAELLGAVATISCGDPMLGKLIADTVSQVGADGIVTIEDSEEFATTAHINEGIELRGGWQMPHFITDQAKQLSQLDDVPVFVTNHDVTNGAEVVKIMESVAAQGKKEAVLIANNISGEAMVACVVNWAQGKFKLLPIKVVAWGEQGTGVLRDVAAATDATFYGKDEGYKMPTSLQDEPFNFDLFGQAGRIIATKDRTTIIGTDEEGTAERIKELNAQAQNAKRAFEAEQIKERIAKLRAGVGVIRVGGTTDAEREERKLRVEDAINAAKAALVDGIVTGGGSALYRAAAAVKSEYDKSKTTVSDEHYQALLIMLRACTRPIKQIAQNAGVVLTADQLTEIKKDKVAFDFNDEKIVDALQAGVIDPTKVVVSALLNATSAAALYLTTEAIVSNADDNEEKL